VMPAPSAVRKTEPTLWALLRLLSITTGFMAQ
jgi:hypothetical protein